MGLCGGKKKDEKKKEEKDGDGKCVLSPNTMKLVTLITLLVSDFDILFTSTHHRNRPIYRGGPSPTGVAAARPPGRVWPWRPLRAPHAPPSSPTTPFKL